MGFKDPKRHADYQNERQQRLRREWLAANGPCRRCGSSIDLQVDHIDPATKVSHRIWSWSEDRRAKELEKCQPLCLVCHQRKSEIEKSIATPHGTVSGYRYHGCRCTECRAAHNERAAFERNAGSRRHE